MTNDRQGMLLVGHGTRDERGVAEFLELAELVKKRLPDVVVEPGFLELAAPTVGDAIRRLVGRGVESVVVTPLLLFAAGHAKQDIPNEVAIAAASFPKLKVRQAEPFGCHPQILTASMKRFVACLGLNALDNTFLVMASRGSSDVEAIADVEEFAAARLFNTRVAEVRTAYMAVAKPRIDEVLEMAAESSYLVIVVQPHLLFHGKVFQDLKEKVAEAQLRSPTKTFIVADYIGPCDEVAIAAIERFREACVESDD